MSDLKMPELPKAATYTLKFTRETQIGTEITTPAHYTAAQMLAIRDQGVAYGMERAAVICDGIADARIRCDLSFTAAQQSAAAIRAALHA
jgi:hypothetical protein